MTPIGVQKIMVPYKGNRKFLCEN